MYNQRILGGFISTNDVKLKKITLICSISQNLNYISKLIYLTFPYEKEDICKKTTSHNDGRVGRL